MLTRCWMRSMRPRIRCARSRRCLLRPQAWRRTWTRTSCWASWRSSRPPRWTRSCWRLRRCPPPRCLARRWRTGRCPACLRRRWRPRRRRSSSWRRCRRRWRYRALCTPPHNNSTAAGNAQHRTDDSAVVPSVSDCQLGSFRCQPACAVVASFEHAVARGACHGSGSACLQAWLAAHLVRLRWSPCGVGEPGIQGAWVPALHVAAVLRW
mmetsp:Transcript_23321/g.59660  ORF Transcript_23321/g.59660 Transcript_23321/m.59660 type:complete len:209 (+) Transcript_23321:541-1167(+)